MAAHHLALYLAGRKDADMWYLIVNAGDGALVSETSEVPAGLDATTYDVIELPDRPDWTVKGWNPAQRTVYDRPIPIRVDRLDDIQARFQADADFMAAWNALTPDLRQQLRTGIRRVLAGILRSLRWRGENDTADLGLG